MTSTQIRILAVLGALVGVLGVFTAVVFALDPGPATKKAARATVTASPTEAGGTTPTRTATPQISRTETASPTLTPTGTPIGGGVVVRAPGLANVRGGPGVEFSILTTLRPGDELPASGRNADASWLLVTHAAGTGWIAVDVVEVVSGALAALPVLPTPPVPRVAATVAPQPLAPATAEPTLPPSRPVATAVRTATPTPVATAQSTVAPTPVRTVVPATSSPTTAPAQSPVPTLTPLTPTARP